MASAARSPEVAFRNSSSCTLSASASVSAARVGIECIAAIVSPLADVGPGLACLAGYERDRTAADRQRSELQARAPRQEIAYSVVEGKPKPNAKARKPRKS